IWTGHLCSRRACRSWPHNMPTTDDFEWLDCENRKRNRPDPRAYDSFFDLVYVIGQPPVTPDTARPFRLVSVGGTFNKLHMGHCTYLKSAAELADKLHIFIASDEYADERKDYRPRPLGDRCDAVKKFLRDEGLADRVTIETLNYVSDIQNYVENCDALDLVVAERTYFEWFDEWNEHRMKAGRKGYHILCRSRTAIGGVDVSSS